MTRQPQFAAVILAAGASRRMGTPKGLLEYRGETFVGRLMRLFGSVSESVIVVSAPGGIAVSGMVVNPDPSRGMLSSLECGLRAVPAEADAVFFTLVDHPAVADETIATLARTWAGELLVIPRYQGQRGHPVLMARALLPEFLSLPESATAREIVSRHESDIRYVDVDDPGVVADIDDPESYRRLLESTNV